MPVQNDGFIERIVVLDRRAFGQKVMAWSKGTEEVPRNLEEAEEQLTGILEFPLPAYITGLNFIETTKEVWTIKLPPPDMLQDTRKRIDDNRPYRLPTFYRQRVEGQIPDTAEDNHMLFEFRVGDYTCSLCT